MERIINEFRVIETDDGFRIEIKGDKEKIRSFIGGFGGPRRWHHAHGRRWRSSCGPFDLGFDPLMWMKTVCGGMWDSEDEETEKPVDA